MDDQFDTPPEISLEVDGMGGIPAAPAQEVRPGVFVGTRCGLCGRVWNEPIGCDDYDEFVCEYCELRDADDVSHPDLLPERWHWENLVGVDVDEDGNEVFVEDAYFYPQRGWFRWVRGPWRRFKHRKEIREREETRRRRNEALAAARNEL